MGAYDYLPKPFTPHELRAVVHQALADMEQQQQNRNLQNQISQKKITSHQLIGSSPKIKKVISMVEKVAPTDATVLVTGQMYSLQSIAAPFPETFSKASFSVIARALLPVPIGRRKAYSHWQTRVPFSWMKSAISAWRSRENCSGSWKRANFCPWAEQHLKKWTCVLFLPPIPISKTWCPKARSGKTFTIESMSTQLSSHPSGKEKWISSPLHIISSGSLGKP